MPDGEEEGKRTLIYTEVPTNVFAKELISSPETPKSLNLIDPCELQSILDGLISFIKKIKCRFVKKKNKRIVKTFNK